MHGITKELEKLVRASQRLAESDENPFPADQTEHAYFDALKAKAARDRYRTLVVVDIISGTSAGGINGICLAKSLAQNAPQDGLRDLWLTRGAIMKLLARRPQLPPLAGNRLLKWLGEALGKMDAEQQGSLMPPGLTLDLFVTTTDIHGYNRRIPIGDPPAVTAVVNKHVFEFHDRDGAGNLGAAHNSALAFAARATSCFPGAFAATHLADIEPEEARDAFAPEFCRAYALAGSPVADTFFIDGGVLDNFPFRHAVRAIPGKPAATEVDRKLLFIEPDPAPPEALPAGRPPGFRRTVWAGLSKLPRRQPIGDALDELMLYNRRVRRVKQMIGVTSEQVLATVAPLLGGDFRSANESANEGAISSNAFGYQSYLRLKLLSVIEGMAAGIWQLAGYPPGTTQALFLRHALLAWGEAAGLLESGAEVTGAQLDFLRTFDLGYKHRRLTFVIGRIDHFYDTESRAILNPLKHRLYELVGELLGVLQRDEAARLRDEVERIFAQERISPFLGRWEVGRFLDSASDDIERLRQSLATYLEETLGGFGGRAYGELERLTSDLPEPVRQDLRAHYVGFPYWDAATYPARLLSEVGELDEVEVVRVSPLDTVRLAPRDSSGEPNQRAKLKGVAIAHFGAFFFRSWRENDYLWGRLDGAERLLWLLGETGDDTARAAFGAIAADERPKLRKTRKLIERVEAYATQER